MMAPEQYLDLTIKLIVAFFIPLGWAAILYPLIRKFKKAWPFLLIAATFFSFAILAAKKTLEHFVPTLDDILSYAFGVFLGAAFLSLLFNFKNKWLLMLPKREVSSRAPENPAPPVSSNAIDKGKTVVHRRSNIHLRHLLQAAILSEEQAKDLYDRLAEKVTDTKIKDLYRSLAQEEVKHKVFIETILYRWLPLTPDTQVLASIEREMREWNILAVMPALNATEEEVVKYAIEQEKRTADFYLSFEKYFPSAWKRMNIQTLVMAERSHADKLIGIYPKFKDTMAF